MGKTTIIDIARSAGVSTATVDRALNGRAGISPANQYRVLQAARKLGYLPFDGLVSLPSRPVHLEFFIPFLHNDFMSEMAASIRNFAADLPLVASCIVHKLDSFGPDALLPALEKMSLKTKGIGLVTVDHPKSREAIQWISESGVRVVTIASDVLNTPRSAYVGVDNTVAGRTAALIMGRMSGAVRGSVGLFLGSHAYHGHKAREFGFTTLLEEGFPNLALLPSIENSEDDVRARKEMAAMLKVVRDLVGVYCVGAGRTGIVEAIREGNRAQRPFVIMHDLTASSRRWLAEDLIDVVIDQNARLVGEQAVIRVLGSIAANAPLVMTRDIEPRIILRENIPVC